MLTTNTLYTYNKRTNYKTCHFYPYPTTITTVAHYSSFKDLFNNNEWVKKSKNYLKNVELPKSIKQIQDKIPSNEIIKDVTNKSSEAINKMGAKIGQNLPDKNSIEKLKDTQIIPESIKKQVNQLPNPMNMLQSALRFKRMAIRSGYVALSVLIAFGAVKGASACINAYKDLKESVER